MFQNRQQTRALSVADSFTREQLNSTPTTFFFSFSSFRLAEKCWLICICIVSKRTHYNHRWSLSSDASTNAAFPCRWYEQVGEREGRPHTQPPSADTRSGMLLFSPRHSPYDPLRHIGNRPAIFAQAFCKQPRTVMYVPPTQLSLTKHAHCREPLTRISDSRLPCCLLYNSRALS